MPRHTRRQGQGLKSGTKKAARAVAPIAKKLAPILIKKVIMPALEKELKKRTSGNGLKLAGQRGRAGQGRKRRVGRPRKRK
jgi:hypothetical protein